MVALTEEVAEPGSSPAVLLAGLLTRLIERQRAGAFPFHARRLAGIDPGRFEPGQLAELPVMTKQQMMASFDAAIARHPQTGKTRRFIPDDSRRARHNPARHGYQTRYGRSG